MKYVLTEKTMNYGVVLHRIQAIKDFNFIKAGDFGGWVEKESNLSQNGDCWVYDNACVFGNARVSGSAKVYDAASVYGDASVSGNAIVYDNALVFGNASVFDNAKVYGSAKVSGNALVFGNAWVSGNAWVYGDASVLNNARVYGNVEITENMISVTRSDGYTFLLANDYVKNVPIVIAGCRYFTFDAAEKHWQSTRGGTKLGDETMSILKHLAFMSNLR